MNEENDIQELGVADLQGETTVNDPHRYLNNTDSDIENATAEANKLNQENEEIKAEMAEANAAMEMANAKAANDQGILPDNPVQLVQETAKAIYGGATDAVESIGSFVDLTGDTITSLSNRIQGNPQEEGQNPFAFKEYMAAGGASPGILDIPDRFEVENNSGFGNLTRGMIEFGLLIKATSMTGGALAPTMFGKTAAFANKVRGAKLLRGCPVLKPCFA